MVQASNYNYNIEPEDNSAGYNYAANNQGIDAYYNTISNWFANNPSQADTLAAMQQYGVSAADIQAATGRTLDSYYAPAPVAPTPVSQPPSNYVTNVPTPVYEYNEFDGSYGPVQQDIPAPVAPTPVVAPVSQPPSNYVTNIPQPVVQPEPQPVYYGGDNPSAGMNPQEQYSGADNPFQNYNPPTDYVAPQSFTPVVPQPVATPATTTPTLAPTVQDYRGVSYDTTTLATLAQQVAQNLDTSRLGGGAFGTNKENIGFDYNTLSGAYKNAPLTTGDQIAFDMARQLIDSGITNLNQIKSQTTYSPATVRQGYDDNGNPTGVWYKYIDQGDGNGVSVPLTADEAKTIQATQMNDGEGGQYTNYTVQNPTTNYVNAQGQVVNPYVGVTYTGPGHTNYYYDAPTGKFYTTGESSSTFGGLTDLLPYAGLALNLIAPGVGTAIGEALGASGIGASMLGNAVISGGLTGAAGGNVLQGALLGGAGAGIANTINPYVGDALNSVGAGGSNALQNAVTGGITSGVLGGNPITGAVSSGIGNILSSNINQNGSITNTLDDGSTITYDKTGNVLSSTPSPYQPAPVVDLNPALNTLTEQQTADLMKNVDPNLINNFNDQPFRVEVGGLPGTAENPGYSTPALMTPGSRLATFDEIDAGQASWNPAANAWEIGGSLPDFNPDDAGVVDLGPQGPVGPSIGLPYDNPNLGTIEFGPYLPPTQPIDFSGPDVGPVMPNTPIDTTPVDTTPVDTGPVVPTNPDVGVDIGLPYEPIDTTPVDTGPGTEPPPPWTPPADEDVPEVVITDDRPVKPVEPPVLPPVVTPDDNVPEIVITDDRPVKPVEPPVVTPPDEDVPEIVITDDRPVKPVEPPPEPPVLPPVEPPLPPVPPVEPPVEPPEPPPEPPLPPEPPVEPPVPPVVVPPVVLPPTPPTPPVVPPTPPVVPPVTPVTPQTGLGLNAGLIRAQPFYNTTNPAQSKFFWGNHGYQTGKEFNPTLWNQAAAPATPWGAQSANTQLTGDEIKSLINGNFQARGPVAPATRVEGYNPASMVQATQANTYQLPDITKQNAASTTPSTPVSTNAQYQQVASVLGNDWLVRQQAAAAAGDWQTYNQIQQQVNEILNPVFQGY